MSEKPSPAKTDTAKTIAKPAPKKKIAVKATIVKASAPRVSPQKSVPAKPAPNPQKEALVAAVKKAEAVKPPPAKPAATPSPAKPVKPEKGKKPKLVRDSFTMPENEYSQLAALKKRLLAQGIAAKKSELLRAGLSLLSTQKDDDLAMQLKKIPALKTGRPAK